MGRISHDTLQKGFYGTEYLAQLFRVSYVDDLPLSSTACKRQSSHSIIGHIPIFRASPVHHHRLHLHPRQASR